MKNQLSPRKGYEGNDILAAVLLLQLYEEAIHQSCRKQQVHREVMIKMLLMTYILCWLASREEM
jgi:hypothetical protein